MKSPSNKKADKGTIVHKVLEILAKMKHAQQNDIETIEDDIIPEVVVDKLFDMEYIENIYNDVYSFYIQKFNHHVWENKDKKDCWLWINKAIDYNNKMFDPRLRQIVMPEQHFDIIIPKSWAKYEFKNKDELITGNLGIKGTIDLITKVNDKTLEIIDWKTGRRLDWATGEEKTLEKLYKDPQLRIYHYAVSQLYPNIEHVIVSINFINDGGAFSVCFEKHDLIETENMLRIKFEEIKKCKSPPLHKSWKCNKLCHFGKTNFENSPHLPIIEYRDNQVTPMGQCMTKCEQIKHETDLNGIDYVIDKYTASGYNVGKYHAPGGLN